MYRLLYCFLFLGCVALAQEDQHEKQAIRKLLDTQEKAWNNYDIEAFMDTYWKSEQLKFYGSSGVIKGWQSTLDRYKKSYPTQAHFGTLKFILNDISKINDGAYSVMGEYLLTREAGDTNGIFMLIVKRIDDEWKIIADTSAKTD
ncbi:nuclear transport factor 2 family protein [uncultured Croceitalea sp.]|uniref:YybH family protein n=1 Tax=uncultured Croceitalea sp. TaxID=1798908 RepID=UPI0033067F0C